MKIIVTTVKTRSTRSTCSQAPGPMPEMAWIIKQFRPSAFPARHAESALNLAANLAAPVRNFPNLSASKKVFRDIWGKRENASDRGWRK